MKHYHGTRTEHGAAVVVEEDGQCYALNPRHDLRMLTATGFDWGFAGNGTAQLALALAADVLGDDDKARSFYQRFKFKFICGLPKEGWVLSENRIRSVLDAIEQEQARSR